MARLNSNGSSKKAKAQQSTGPDLGSAGAEEAGRKCPLC
jgi:hypothetical protein